MIGSDSETNLFDKCDKAIASLIGRVSVRRVVIFFCDIITVSVMGSDSVSVVEAVFFAEMESVIGSDSVSLTDVIFAETVSVMGSDSVK